MSGPDVTRRSLAGLAAVGLGAAGQPPPTRPKLQILDAVNDPAGGDPHATAFRSPRFLRALGFDGQVLNDHRYIQTAVLLDDYEPRLYPAGSEARAWVERRGEELDRYIADCRAAGVRSFVFTDMLVLPRSAKALFGEDIVDPAGRYTLAKPRCVELHRALFDAIGRRFPDLDGIVVRTGETYLHDVPFHDGNSPLTSPAATAPLDEARQAHTTLIGLLRDELCEKHAKTVIYRTWAFGGIHTEPAAYRSVTDPVAPHPRLFISIKHTKGDFHRNFDFNPTLGIGGHPQIVEVQCQREFEGKGAYPNYIAQGVIDGFEELADKPRPRGLRDLIDDPRFAGVWAWSRGGGWKGPYINNEFWCELNAVVLARWAATPERSEAEIFDGWVRERLSLTSADRARFRRLCLLSAQAVLRGRSSRIVHVNPFWIRDEFIGGLVPTEVSEAANEEQWGILNGTFDGILSAGLVEPVLAEKDEAAAMWREIERLADEIESGPPREIAHIRTSCRYGRLLHEIIAGGWRVMLKGLEGDRAGAHDLAALQQGLRLHDEAWAAYGALIAEGDQVATPYVPYGFVYQGPDYRGPHGLKETVDRYRALVA